MKQLDDSSIQLSIYRNRIIHIIFILLMAVIVTASMLELSKTEAFALQAKSMALHITTVSQPRVPVIKRVSRKSRKVKGKRLFFDNGLENLRVYIGEKHRGYAVMQGGCTDGKYAYYLMVSTENQHGRVAKVRMRDNKLMKVSDVLDIWHGNGMAYDSKRKQLVVTSRDDPDMRVYRRQEITCIDAKTLRIIPSRQHNVRYSYFSDDTENFTYMHRSCGLASIAYCPKYDVYIADQRVFHNLIVINPDTFEAMGLVRTNYISKYPGVFQGMDADDQYVYMLLSPEEDGHQKKNLIVALDWNCKKLRDSDGRRKKYVSKPWSCRHKGKPAAVYTLNIKDEGENIYHTTDRKGRTHFYVSEYKYDHNYTKYTVRTAYKSWWRQIRTRANKGSLKGKWYMRWFFRTKYSYTTEKVSPRHCRLNYVYDLGVL